MRALGILKYECKDTDAVLSRLPKKEEERLRGKAREYVLSSAMGRLLLFSLCDRLLGKNSYEKRVAYREHPAGKGMGAPYLVNMEHLSVSISHTEGGCAVFLCDEGECGVDMESITSLKAINEKRQRVIEKRFHLSDFQEKIEADNDNLTTIVYIYNEKLGVLEQKEEKQPTKISSEGFEFLAQYTRMEAVGKTFGLGVSFLSKREEYLSRVRVKTQAFDDFVVSFAYEK